VRLDPLLPFTCGVLVLLATIAQINPVWLVGPYQPGGVSAGAVPDWYMGFLDGALRLMPAWELSIAGHPLALGVLVPGLLVPGAFFTLLAACPLLERRLIGDGGVHHVLDRPRDAATRTAAGVAGITFYGVLWAAAANDQIAYHFQLDLYAVTWFFRIAVLAGPPLAYTITQRICLGLTARERGEAEHGRPTGRIVMSPDGGFSEITEPARPVRAEGPGSNLPMATDVATPSAATVRRPGSGGRLDAAQVARQRAPQHGGDSPHDKGLASGRVD
jgi:ubiquinol-cytochrome c reductase cytochrome b subunit